MTAFYKVVSDGFIDGFGTNGNDEVTEITEAEYGELVAFFHTRPTAPDGKAYRMKADPLEWVLVDAPIEDDDIDDAEAYNIIFGGVE